MAGVRAQLARTRRLEATKVHPMLAALGGEEGWFRLGLDVEAGLNEGRYDIRDVPHVMQFLRHWIGPNRSEEGDL